jgi:3-hydroxyisobutyrate dehydrogenase-like beta-hydroxyacid dehydrogenase
MTTAPATVGVVGLGNMGLPMAGHLLAVASRPGRRRAPRRSDALARGGTPTASPSEERPGRR